MIEQLPANYTIKPAEHRAGVHLQMSTRCGWRILRDPDTRLPLVFGTIEQAIPYAVAHARLQLNYNQLVPEEDLN